MSKHKRTFKVAKSDSVEVSAGSSAIGKAKPETLASPQSFRSLPLKLTTKTASWIIAAVGILTFAVGLGNPFWGDDRKQIVDNIPVHSITNLMHFFNSGTFTNSGQGSYYRPLMTAMFSLAYTLGGPHPLLFHLIQLAFAIGSAILFFLVLRRAFGPWLSLTLSLFWLVHPLNSQAVFAIPSLQDAMYVFFGLLALWILLRYRSTRSLILAAGALLLSLLSKESGILFVFVTIFYLLLFDRRRLKPFAALAGGACLVYAALHLHAVGLPTHDNPAPIDRLSLGNRLMTDPSIIRLYITLLVFPVKLATGYYWISLPAGLNNFVMPLIIDGAVIGLLAGIGLAIRRAGDRAGAKTYLFFSAWTVAGVAILMQVFPLDMTACEDWFYFPMLGLLGMIGTAIQSLFPIRTWNRYFIPLVSLTLTLIGLLTVRTIIRGTEYHDPLALSRRDMVVSREDYAAADRAALALADTGQYSQAVDLTNFSIGIYPYSDNYTNLGWIKTGERDYPGAIAAYQQALTYGLSAAQTPLLEDYASVSLVHGDPYTTRQLLLQSLAHIPREGVLWTDLAFYYTAQNDQPDARKAITQAAKYTKLSPSLYAAVYNGRPFQVDINHETISFP